MILKGAGVCPFIKIGDVVKGGTVTDLVCDKNLAMIVVERGHEMYDYIHPASVSWVNCNECPKLVKDPNRYSKTKWCRELVQAARERGEAVDREEARERLSTEPSENLNQRRVRSDLMILEGAGICPFIKIGGVVKGRTVTDLVCDKNTATACRAFRAVAMIVLGKGLEMRDYMNPAAVGYVDCDKCPILAWDPDHRSKTKWCRELVQAAEAAEELGDHNRFDIIDISDEEEQNGKSSGNPNQ